MKNFSVTVDVRRFLLSTLVLFAFGAVATTTASAQAAAVVLKGGKLLTISHGTIENGVLVMQNGKITAVGAASAVRSRPRL